MIIPYKTAAWYITHIIQLSIGVGGHGVVGESCTGPTPV